MITTKPAAPTTRIAPACTIVQIGRGRAKLYREGGITFEYLQTVSTELWIVDEEPTAQLEIIADAARTAIYGFARQLDIEVTR
jgi:hypothetical protein